MNIKSLLLTSAVAAVASIGSTAFANNFFETGYETQLAQAPGSSARVATDAGFMKREDINTAAKLTRAEVRAETVKALANGEARALRDTYVGGAQ